MNLNARTAVAALVVASLAWTSALCGQQVKSRPLAGIVVDRSGNPVAAAEVWLVTSQLDGSPGALSKTRTDKDGRFRVEVPMWWFQMSHSLRQELGLITHKQGFGVGGVAFTRSSIPPESGARLELGTLADSSITVLGPGKKALAKASVAAQSLMIDQVESGVSEDYARRMAESNNWDFKTTPNGYLWRKTAIPLPEELSRQLAVTTDQAGRAQASAFAFADISGLKISTETFGTQVIVVSPYSAPGSTPKMEMPKTIVLKPVGRLAGRVTAKDLEAIRGLTLTFSTHDEVTPKDSLMYLGHAQVKIDAEGKFETAVLPQGNLRVHLPLGGTPYRIDGSFKQLPKIKAGEQAEVEIPLRFGVEVTGVVRERGADRPIPHLLVLIGHGDGNTFEQLETDAQGRYTCRVPAGQIYQVAGIPKEFMPLDRQKQFRPIDVPDVARHELPAIELERAPRVRGVVVDDAGKPVPGAAVEAHWLGYGHRTSMDEFHDVSKTSDQRGEFAIDSVILRTEAFPGRSTSKETELRLKARHQGAFSEKPLVLRGDLSKPVTLTISKSHALALSGKVIDAAGKPVADAKIKIWQRPYMPPPNLGTPRLVTFAAEAETRTDSAGRFQTPRQLERDGDYRAEIEGAGIQAAKTDWLQVGDGKSDVFPAVVVHRARAVTGRIVDRQGKPVQNAKIMRTDDGPQRLQAVADVQGRFTLENVPDNRGFLFIEADGCRFHGQILAAGAADVDVVITRRNEPAKPLRTLAEAPAKQERLALAKRFLDPVVQRLSDKSEDYEKHRTLEALAKVDPSGLLELLDKKTFKDARFNDSYRSAAALSLAETSLDEAVALAETISGPYARASAYYQLADALPESKHGRALELLGQALVQARAEREAAYRAVLFGIIADRLFKLGEKDRATKVIDEGRPIAKNLPTAAWAGYARAVFAESLALVDLPAALALTQGLSEPGEADRHHGNIAHKIAAVNPAESERILGMLKDQSRTYRWMYPERICYRMAAVDLERARRIAASIGEPFYQAHAYGVMAQSLAKSQPAEATKLLNEAFDKLRAIVESGKDRYDGGYDAASLAASLLPVAEAIDPHLVAEFLWRAVALRHHPAEKNERYANEYETAIAPGRDASLALMLARYDRELARGFLRPDAKQALAALRTGRASSVVVAPLLIEPRLAVELVDSLPDGPEKDGARRKLATLLTLSGDALWRAIIGSAGIWVVDTEDLF